MHPLKSVFKNVVLSHYKHYEAFVELQFRQLAIEHVVLQLKPVPEF